MSSQPTKIIINVESPIEQQVRQHSKPMNLAYILISFQETLKNNRKNLKVIQKTARDKENLVGRIPFLQKAAFTKSKS